MQRSRIGTSWVSPAPLGVGRWWNWIESLYQRGCFKNALCLQGGKRLFPFSDHCRKGLAGSAALWQKAFGLIPLVAPCCSRSSPAGLEALSDSEAFPPHSPLSPRFTVPVLSLRNRHRSTSKALNLTSFPQIGRQHHCLGDLQLLQRLVTLPPISSILVLFFLVWD